MSVKINRKPRMIVFTDFINFQQSGFFPSYSTKNKRSLFLVDLLNNN